MENKFVEFIETIKESNHFISCSWCCIGIRGLDGIHITNIKQSNKKKQKLYSEKDGKSDKNKLINYLNHLMHLQDESISKLKNYLKLHLKQISQVKTILIIISQRINKAIVDFHLQGLAYDITSDDKFKKIKQP